MQMTLQGSYSPMSKRSIVIRAHFENICQLFLTIGHARKCFKG